MNGTLLRGRWVACAALLVGGCGAIPDLIVEPARSSAKAALEETVEGFIHDAVKDTFEGLLDPATFEFPSIRENEEVEGGDGFEGVSLDVDDSAEDTSRVGKPPGAQVRITLSDSAVAVSSLSGLNANARMFAALGRTTGKSFPVIESQTESRQHFVARGRVPSHHRYADKRQIASTRSSVAASHRLPEPASPSHQPPWA